MQRPEPRLFQWHLAAGRAAGHRKGSDGTGPQSDLQTTWMRTKAFPCPEAEPRIRRASVVCEVALT